MFSLYTMYLYAKKYSIYKIYLHRCLMYRKQMFKIYTHIHTYLIMYLVGALLSNAYETSRW